MADQLIIRLAHGFPPTNLKQMLLLALCDTEDFEPYIARQILANPTPEVIYPDPYHQKGLDEATRLLQQYLDMTEEGWIRDYEQLKSLQKRVPAVWDSLTDVNGVTRGERRSQIEALKALLADWNPSPPDFTAEEFEVVDGLKSFALTQLEKAARSSKSKTYPLAASLEEFRKHVIAETQKTVRDHTFAVKKAQLRAEEATAMLQTLLECLPEVQTHQSVTASEAVEPS